MTVDELNDGFAHMRDHAWLVTQGLFVAEGRHVATRLIQSPRFRTVAVLLTPTAQAAMGGVIEAAGLEPSRVIVRAQAELDAITGFNLHQGCVALAERPDVPTALPANLDGPILVLERVRDPDNVGSIIRSADALGGAGVLLGPECADPFYRKAVRTSMGSVFSMPLAIAAEWPDALVRLKTQGRSIVALAPGASALISQTRSARVSKPVALLFGSEGEGLTPEARALADTEARIVMASTTDSLNVAVAAAVALYGWQGVTDAS